MCVCACACACVCAKLVGCQRSPSHAWPSHALPPPPTSPPLQVNYPRSPSIRWKWLARRVAELVVTSTLLSIVIIQYLAPSIENSMQPLKEVRLCVRARGCVWVGGWAGVYVSPGTTIDCRHQNP